MIIEEEIWLPVLGFERFYSVSNFGRVKSLHKNGKILKQNKSKHGYLYVILTNETQRKGFRINRLVAIAFIPNQYNKPIVNHKNGIKTDNRSVNLEWYTYKENREHAISINLMPRYSEGLKMAHKAMQKPIEAFNKITGEKIWVSDSIRSAEAAYGLDSGNMTRVLKGISKTTKGLILKYKEDEK